MGRLSGAGGTGAARLSGTGAGIGAGFGSRRESANSQQGSGPASCVPNGRQPSRDQMSRDMARAPPHESRAQKKSEEDQSSSEEESPNRIAMEPRITDIPTRPISQPVASLDLSLEAPLFEQAVECQCSRAAHRIQRAHKAHRHQLAVKTQVVRRAAAKVLSRAQLGCSEAGASHISRAD